MRTKQKGFTLIELLIVVAIILIIAAIAIPNLLRSKIAANEASAVGSIRTIVTSEVSFYSTWGIGYSATLTTLGGTLPCTASSTTACLIDQSLAAGAKSGYKFVETGGTADANGIVQTFAAGGTPVTVGTTGQRSFCSDESGVVRFNTSGTTAPTTDTGCEAWSALQ